MPAGYSTCAALPTCYSTMARWPPFERRVMEGAMFRKLVKTADLEIDGRSYVARYFELRTARGSRRYSCEVVLEAADRIIVDDDSLTSLESKVARLVPATIYSRLLARPAVVAA
jgi:hypothetical protein